VCLGPETNFLVRQELGNKKRTHNTKKRRETPLGCKIRKKGMINKEVKVSGLFTRDLGKKENSKKKKKTTKKKKQNKKNFPPKKKKKGKEGYAISDGS